MARAPMSRSSYPVRDYSFGQQILALRTESSLTQSALAELLGISRQAVVGWEAGTTYPSPQHLKHLIEIFLKNSAFHGGQEAEEIRAVWQSAHLRVPLDEPWLTRLLEKQKDASAALLAVHPPPALVAEPAPRGPLVDWGDAPEVTSFYGRESELGLLTKWLVEDQCRVVSILGMGGIGKSALAVTLMHRAADQFDAIIWRSLRDAPPCEPLLDELLYVLAGAPLTIGLDTLERRLNLFFQYLRTRRVLLVLDDLESVMEPAEGSGRMLPNYEGYGRLLRRAAETKHGSCVLLTSREKPFELAPLEGGRTLVRSMHLGRLDAVACKALLHEQEVTGSTAERERLIERYGGNPLALKIVAPTITDLFGGEIDAFLEQGETIFGGVRHLLQQQFARLSTVEESIMLWLAILREPVTVQELAALLVNPLPRAQILEALEALRGRSLIEPGKAKGSFTLQSVVLEYTTTHLVEAAVGEIERGQVNHLLNHRLQLASAKEYIWHSQARLIVAPILTRLRSTYPESAALENRLLALLEPLRGHSEEVQGYAPANLLTLLHASRGDLSALDLHQLAIRELDLRGVNMRDTRLAEATLRDARLTEAFDTIWSMAFSQNGTYWAGGDRQGQAQLWAYSQRRLQHTWRAHQSVVSAIAFSPDEQRLATGSWDGVIKVWASANGTLLWTSPLGSAISALDISPDGRALASGGTDGQIRIWDITSGELLQTLNENRGPVFCVAWSPAGEFLAGAGHDARIRLWATLRKDSPALKPTPVRSLEGHSGPVRGLAFSPDGETLASASWDRTVRFWDPARGTPKEIIPISSRLSGLVWSQDGRYLAAGELDRAFWVWDLEQHKPRATFYGTMAPVRALAFSPDSSTLDAACEDGSMQVWDMDTGQCIRTWRGFAHALYDVAWRPNNAQIASGGNDGLITIWNVASVQTRQTPSSERESSSTPDHLRVAQHMPLAQLRGHKMMIWGVAWSHDERLLASCSEGNTIRIWDVVKGVSERVLTDPELVDAQLFAVAWSADDKRLAVATHRRGVLVYDMRTQTFQRVGRSEVPPRIHRVAWSPDGRHLAGGGEGGTIVIWDADDYSWRATLEGHRGMVSALAWSSDSRRLASGSWGYASDQLFIWDTRSWKRRTVINDPNESVYGVAWSADGAVLVSAGTDGTLRWWNSDSGPCTLTRQGHQGPILSLRASPDGRLLASCGNDGAIRLWRLDSGEHLTTLRPDRPYERLDITGIKGLTDAQKLTLKLMGAIEQASDN